MGQERGKIYKAVADSATPWHIADSVVLTKQELDNIYTQSRQKIAFDWSPEFIPSDKLITQKGSETNFVTLMYLSTTKPRLGN